jgi:hypothetical protein
MYQVRRGAGDPEAGARTTVRRPRLAPVAHRVPVLNRSRCSGPGAASRRPRCDPSGRGAALRVGGRNVEQGSGGDRGALRRLRGTGRAGADPRRLAGGGDAIGRARGSARRPHRAPPALAVPAMGLVGAIAGYGFAVSPRLAIAGLTVALSLLISQGLEIPISHAPEALLFAGLGGVLQVAFSLAVYAAGDRGAEKGENRWDADAARRSLSANLTLSSTAARHALRFGAAMAAGRRRLLASGSTRARLLDPADDYGDRPSRRHGRLLRHADRRTRAGGRGSNLRTLCPRRKLPPGRFLASQPNAARRRRDYRSRL